MNQEIKIECLEKNKIPYQIKNKDIHTIRMHFNSNAVLIISCPKNIKIESLSNFINNNLEWVKKKYLIIHSKQISYENNAKQYYLGKICTLKINLSKTRMINLVDDLLLISVNDLNQVRNDVIKWRYSKAELIFQELCYACFLKMKDYLTIFPKVVIKESKTKWGCCYINENKIMLNVSLTQLPIYLIEYVIFHELSHFVVHNHSKEFHAFLQQFVFNERKCYQELKKYNNIV